LLFAFILKPPYTGKLSLSQLSLRENYVLSDNGVVLHCKTDTKQKDVILLIYELMNCNEEETRVTIYLPF
jgi:hypothetical protein